MRALTSTLAWGYLGLAILALLYPLINSRGWFGMAPDPLSGVFAVILAQPWASLFGHRLASPSFLEGLGFVAACVGLNAILLFGLRRLFQG